VLPAGQVEPGACSSSVDLYVEALFPTPVEHCPERFVGVTDWTVA